MREKLSRLLTDLVDLAARDLLAFPVTGAHREELARLGEEIAAIDRMPSETGIHHTRFALQLLHVLKALYAAAPNGEEDARALRSFGLSLIPWLQRDAHRALRAEHELAPAED
jgi:hypothetical protein